MVLRGKTILVTGAAGFVGSHIVDQALQAGVARVVVLDNFVRGVVANLAHLKNDRRVKLVKGDIRNTALIHRLMSGIDFVSHQAAIRLTKCQEDPRLGHEVMVDGTFNVFEAAAAAKVKKIVMASSVSVYGEPSYLPIDENHPYNNTTVYGAAKIANEHLAIAFHHLYNLPTMLLRYFNVYGPRMDIVGAYTEVLIKWLDKIDAGQAPVIHGDGRQALDFVYVEDVAWANIRALESDISFGIYNVGTGKATSLTELAQTLIDITGTKVKPVYLRDVQRPYVQKRQADVRKIKRELKFAATTPLLVGLKKLVEWRKENLRLTQHEKKTE